jgi:hypothetical protein
MRKTILAPTPPPGWMLVKSREISRYFILKDASVYAKPGVDKSSLVDLRHLARLKLDPDQKR